MAVKQPFCTAKEARHLEMRAISLMLVLSLLATGPIVGASESPDATESPDAELTIVADNENCEGDASLCYHVVEGNLSDIQPGAEVTVTLENQGEIDHELMARTLGGTVIAPPSMANTTDETKEEDHDAHDESSSEDHEASANRTEEDHEGNQTSSEDGNETHTEEESGDHHDGDTNETGSEDHDSGNETASGEEHHDDEDATQENHRTSDENEASGGHTEGSGGHEAHLVPPGESRTMTFTVPEDAEGVYLWCSVPGHEEAGMANELTFQTMASGEQNEAGPAVPMVPVLLAITALGAAPVALKDWD